MKITIITATYNSAATIARCISSVNEQTHNNIEHIIVDGASDDQTLEIIKSLPNRVTHVISEPDKGIYDALNKGIALATGDVIGFLHSDDTFNSPATLQYIAACFSGNPLCSGVYGDLLFTNRENEIVRFWKSAPFKQRLLYFGWMPPHPTLFLRNEVYRKQGLFTTTLTCAADYDYILRVFRNKTLTHIYLPGVITNMRMGGISTGGIKNLVNKKREDYWVLKKNKMPFPFLVLIAKNISKVSQLWVK
jgi:glycosyltransferase